MPITIERLASCSMFARSCKHPKRGLAAGERCELPYRDLGQTSSSAFGSANGARIAIPYPVAVLREPLRKKERGRKG